MPSTYLPPPIPDIINNAFARYTPETIITLQHIRGLIFQAAMQREEIGPLHECLKWGEAAYVTQQTKSGTTLRLAETRDPQRPALFVPALFVHCQTRLIEHYRQHYPTQFDYQGNRALIIPFNWAEHRQALQHCITLALTYHLNSKTI